MLLKPTEKKSNIEIYSEPADPIYSEIDETLL